MEIEKIQSPQTYLLIKGVERLGFEITPHEGPLELYESYGIYMGKNYLGLLDCHGRFDISSVAQEGSLKKLTQILEQYDIPINRLCQMSSEPELGLDLA